jgi:hypothetical protein
MVAPKSHEPGVVLAQSVRVQSVRVRPVGLARRLPGGRADSCRSWSIPERQIETSVVLAEKAWLDQG